MKRYRKIVYFVLLIVGWQMWSSKVVAEDYTFSRAWQDIQQISDVLAAEQANVERSEIMQDATRSLNYPQVELSGSYNRLDDEVEANALDFNPLAGLEDNPIGQDIIGALGGQSAFTTEITNQSFGRLALTALWPIYTGGRITAAQDMGEAQTDIAAQLFDVQKRTVFEQLVKIYFGVVLAQQNMETHRQAELGFLKHLENAVRLESEGQIAKVERLSIAVAHDRARTTSLKAQKALEIAQVSLRQLLHASTDVHPTDQLFTNSSIPEDQLFISSSLDGSPLLKSLEARDRELQAIESAKRGRYYPEVSLYADYALYNDNSIVSDALPDWQVGVVFTLPLLDRSNRSKNIDATLKAQESVARLSDSTRRALTVATQVAHKRAQQALQEYEGRGSSLDLSKENLFMRQKAFKEGFSTSSQLIDAQIFVSVARTERSAAAYNYILSLSQLLALSGEVSSFGHYQNTARQEEGFRGSSR
jgi:outer membrane protein TolC